MGEHDPGLQTGELGHTVADDLKSVAREGSPEARSSEPLTPLEVTQFAIKLRGHMGHELGAMVNVNRNDPYEPKQNQLRGDMTALDMVARAATGDDLDPHEPESPEGATAADRLAGVVQLYEHARRLDHQTGDVIMTDNSEGNRYYIYARALLITRALEDDPQAAREAVLAKPLEVSVPDYVRAPIRPEDLPDAGQAKAE